MDDKEGKREEDKADAAQDWSTPADVLSLLAQQHLKLETLFDQLLECEETVTQRRALKRVGDDLAVHIAAEAMVFCPTVRTLRTESYGAKCKVLQEQTEHQQEEEEHLFPKVARLLDATRRRRLGEAVRRHEESLRAKGAPRNAVHAQTDSAAPLG
jgi:hypothetical protein